MRFPRNITKDLLNALQDTPVVLIDGPRQSGKTTIAKCLSKAGGTNRRYLTFDDPAVSAAAVDAQEFIAGLPESVIIDEVQRAPHIFLAIKKSVDENRKPGRFILTGSANVFKLPRLNESLAGRMEIHTLWPLSYGEMHTSEEHFVDAVFEADLPKELEPIAWCDLASQIVCGGFPDVVTRATVKRRQHWLSSYLKTVIERDIRDLSEVEGLTSLYGLVRFLAVKAGTLLNIADISIQAGVAQTTLKRYLALLEALFLFVRLPAWFGNPEKRLIKTPKCYFTDTGLLCHLRHVDERRLIEDKSTAGLLLENYVFTQLLKQIGWSDLQPAVYHYRTHEGREVDFVLEAGDGRIVGIEVKAASSITQNDFAGLRHLQQVAGERFYRGILLYTGPQLLRFDKQLNLMPISALWQLGAQPSFNIFLRE